MPEPQPTYTFKQRLILAVVPRLAYMIICLLGVTLRYPTFREGLRALRDAGDHLAAMSTNS